MRDVRTGPVVVMRNMFAAILACIARVAVPPPVVEWMPIEERRRGPKNNCPGGML